MRFFLVIFLFIFAVTSQSEEVTVTEGQVIPENFEPITQDINGRLDRLEKYLNNSALLDMLDVLEQLKLEVSELRGKIEIQTHTLEQLQIKQRDLYTDADSRLQKLETAKASTKTDDAIVINSETNVTEDEVVDTENTEQNQPETVAEVREAMSVDPVKVEAEYQRAFKFLKESQYDRALSAFKQYLKDYPGSDFADNAQYWLGETRYVMQQYDKAISEYQALLNSYPESQKISHAMLKIGYSYAELGNAGDAEKMLNKVKIRYPGTTAARLAEERLRKLQQSKETNT